MAKGLVDHRQDQTPKKKAEAGLICLFAEHRVGREAECGSEAPLDQLSTESFTGSGDNQFLTFLKWCTAQMACSLVMRPFGANPLLEMRYTPERGARLVHSASARAVSLSPVKAASEQIDPAPALLRIALDLFRFGFVSEQASRKPKNSTRPLRCRRPACRSSRRRQPI
jgi:hypothetical protein